MNQRTASLVVSIVVVGFAACGGKVTFDGLPGTSGGGGSGGATSNGPSVSHTNGVVVSSVANVSTVSIDVSVGPTDAVTQTATFDSISVSSGVSSICDNTGDCNNDDMSCVSCAVAPNGPCALQAKNCEGDTACIAFSNCVDGCMDPNCESSCEMQFPDGFSLYTELVDCAVCEACASDCANVGFPCSG